MHKSIRAVAAPLCAGLMLGFSIASAGAAEIKVLTVGALQNALKAIAADFTKETGDQVAFTFTSPAALNGVLAGNKFDAIIAATSSIEELDKSGGLQAG